MNQIVNPSQAAFIQGRYILNNVLLAQEILHFSRVQKQKVVVLKIVFEKAYDRVNWAFIHEILIGRGFGSLFISWILKLLHNSQTCININGSLTHYFICKRGLRQGDPLSPYLFNLVADSLCKIIDKGRLHHQIHGLGPPVHDGLAIVNCHYVDDIIFFLKADIRNVENILWALFSFEALSSIKINFNKTEMVPLNLSDAESSALASIF